MRAAAALALCLAGLGCDRDATKPAARPVTWTVATTWAGSSAEVAGEPHVFVVPGDAVDAGAPSLAGSARPAPRWRGADDPPSVTPDHRLITVAEQPTALVVRVLDPATGAPDVTATIARTGPAVEWVVSGDALLTLDGTQVQAFSLADGARLWSLASRRRALELIGAWDGLVVFQHPYTAIDTASGATRWQVAGWGFAARLDRDHTVLQLDGDGDQVAVVARDGTRVTWPGKARAAGAGTVVYERGGAWYRLVAASRQTHRLPIAGVAPGSPMSLDDRFLYFHAGDGTLRELDLVAGTTVVVCRCGAALGEPSLIAPIVAGDRIYVFDGGWIAFDRSPSKPR